MDNFDMSDIGISIDELNRTWENPETVKLPVGTHKVVDTTPQKQAAYERKTKNRSVCRTVYWVMVCVATIIMLISVMLNNAEAGMAIMKFTVVSVSDDTITVRDEHGDVFDFFKGADSTNYVGQEVTVATDLVYNEKDATWKWNEDRTAIID